MDPTNDDGIGHVPMRIIPLRPMAYGFFINTLCFTVAWWVVLVGFGTVWCRVRPQASSDS